MQRRPFRVLSLTMIAVIVGLFAAFGDSAFSATYTIEAIETWVTAPNGNQLYTRIVQPVPALYPGQRFPALIAIPGGTGAGAPLADNPLYRNLAASGFVVVVFNPEGRGTGLPGNRKSQGTEDCNGFVHQDDLKAIVEYTATLPNVTATNIGVETASFGIAIGAGALGRYPGLPVAYLVDQEGPHDNRVITFYDAGRETAVCGHLSTVTDSSPENVTFWAEREAVRYIGSYPGRYLRMQAEIDHAQNPGYFRHALEMINAATKPEYGGTGSALWTRMNGSDLGNAINAVYPLNDPSQYPTWVSGRLSDHLGLNLTYDREMAALVAAGAGEDFVLTGKRLRVRDKDGDPAKRRLAVVSKDPSVTAATPGSGGDPTLGGGLLEVLNPTTGEIDTFDLPATNWSGLGTPPGSKGYRYTDTALAAGPCKRVMIKAGRRLKARCTGNKITFSLDEPFQGNLGVRLTTGTDVRYCLLFGGTIKKDTPATGGKTGFFLAKDAPAPGACPEVTPTALPPVYLTIVSHNEEPLGGRPDYTADPNFYLQNRNLVKMLAETITSRGATYNFQSDWNYLKAVAMYDVGSVTDNTAGKNIVRWMREDLGVEVDPHAHETQYNYADVAYLIEQLGVTPSKNAGGFLYDPPDNSQGWEQHLNGIYGWVYPTYFWRADHLWGAATYLHQGNDDKSSGIWRPKDRYNFYVDDPNQQLLYIGGCNGPVGLLELLEDIEARQAPADGFYTANLMMIQDFMTEQSITQLGSFIDSLAPYVAQGRVRWVTLSQMAELWRTEYGSRPFRYDCASGTPTPLYISWKSPWLSKTLTLPQSHLK